MEVEHCNIVLSLTESIEYYSAVPVVRLPVLWMKSLNDGGRSCSPNICLQPRQAVVWLRTRAASVPLLIRNVHVSSASAASSSSATLLTPLPLLLLSGCWPVHFLVPPLSDIITSCCAPALYIRTSWWFMRDAPLSYFRKLVDLMLHTFPFVRESQDSPGSNSGQI